MSASPLTLDEACEYVRVQRRWTPQQLLEHRDEIAAALRSGMSVGEVVAAYTAGQREPA